MRRAALIVALLGVALASARAQEEPLGGEVVAPQDAAVLGGDDYQKILGMSYEFYEGQMSGRLPSWNRLLYSKGGWKKSAHVKDGASIGKDLSGGFYDAGDYLKCPHALAWGVTNLIFSLLEFRPAYAAAGQTEIAKRSIQWALDWLVKAHVRTGSSPGDNAFVGQVSAKPDHHYFGRPEHATNERPIYLADSSSPGADLAGEYAAAFAAGAVLFRGINADYANALFAHAKQAFDFANAYRANWKTPGGVFQAYGSYWPDGYIAHLAWASAWMCRYSADYCPLATQWFNTAMNNNNLRYGLGYDWDSTMPGVAALVISMNLQPIAGDAKTYLEGYVLRKWQDTSSKCPAQSYSTVCYTPKGLAYYSDWGTLRNTGNMMFIAALMGKFGDNKAANLQFACGQMRYITGASTGKSYLIGYGPDQPKRPHHRQAACSPRYNEPCSPFNGGTCCAGEHGVGAGGCCDETNFRDSHPSLISLKGAIVGGPDQSDVFPDIRDDYQRSEVAYDYNAGFTGAAAGLANAALNGFTCSGGGGGGGGGGAPPPPPPSGGGGGGGGGGSCLPNWKQCGGKSGGGSSDAAWAKCCGGVCKRENEWYWQCAPAALSALKAPAAPGVLAAPAPAAVDDLQLAAPVAAAAGAPLEVTATLLRAGRPVPGAVVQFMVAPATPTLAGGADLSVAAAPAPAMFSALTGLDGKASLALPASVGTAGTASLLSASVEAGKALGAKGAVAIVSPELTVAWQ